MHLQHHCKDSVMKQFKTQCYLIRETTMKAVRQRQPSFSLLANGNNMHLPLERKPKPSCCDLDNTGTVILQDRRPLRARNHLRAGAQYRGLALLAYPSCYIRPSLMLSSTARRDQFLRKIAWARRGEQPYLQSEKPIAANCRLLPVRGWSL